MSRRTWCLGLIALLVFVAVCVALLAGPRAAAAPPAPTPVPEESATISDDPTVAPDAAQSADRSVSFPSDI